MRGGKSISCRESDPILDWRPSGLVLSYPLQSEFGFESLIFLVGFLVVATEQIENSCPDQTTYQKCGGCCDL